MPPIPYELTLEFARADAASEPFNFQFARQRYLLRQEGGRYDEAIFPWSEQVLGDLAELTARHPERSRLQRLGDTLRSFLAHLGWELHEARIQQALDIGSPVALTIRSAAAELYALPWELLALKSTGQHLGELPGCLIRYEWPGTHTAPPRPSPPPENGRILFAWSAAGGQVPALAHLRALTEACAGAEYAFEEHRDVLAHASLRGLAERLSASPEPIAALHLLCHGSRTTAGTYGLCWNASESGETPEVLDAGALRQVLAPHAGRLRMVVLCACQSGDPGPFDSHLGSVSQALHRVGIPAVVASRLPLSVRGSLILAETLYAALLQGTASSLGPVSLEAALRQARHRLASEALCLDWASLQFYARAEDGTAHRPFIFRPYRGLEAFEPRHRHFFFGREPLQEVLLRRIQEAAEGKRPRFQVVAGASGCGKSSLVLAGLVPALPTVTWDFLMLRPGDSGAQQIVEETRRSLAARPGRMLLVLVDQFEEVFTQLSPEERQKLVHTLWALSEDKALGLVVITTLRIDYFEQCGGVSVVEGGSSLEVIVYDDAHRLFVPQLQPAQLKAAIEGPAHKVGLTFEEGLTERLAKDVGQEPGALPLLEYTLDLLWQRRRGNFLTHEAYKEVGGVTGALTQTVDRLYERLSPIEQRQTRRLLVELVDFRDEVTLHTRRRARWAQVRPAGAAEQAAFDGVLAQFVACRLLVKSSEGTKTEASGDAFIEVAHEALIRRWGRLGEWLRADRVRVLQLREIQTSAESWWLHRSDPDRGLSYLPSGNRLESFQDIQKQQAQELSQVARAFLNEATARERTRRQLQQAFAQIYTFLDQLRDPATHFGTAGTRKAFLDRVSKLQEELRASAEGDGTALQNHTVAHDNRGEPDTSYNEWAAMRMERACLMVELDQTMTLMMQSMMMQWWGEIMFPIRAAKVNFTLFLEDTRHRNDPSDSEFHRDRMVGYTKLGEVAQAAGRLSDARRDYQQAFDIAHALALADPNAELLRHLSNIYNHLGEVAQAEGKLSDARAAFQQALDITHALVADVEGDSGPLGESGAKKKLFRDLRREIAANADTGFRLAFKLVEEMTKVDSTTAELHRDITLIHRDYGTNMAVTDPTSPELRRDLSVRYNKIGEVAQAEGNLSDARAAFQQAFDITQALAAAEPTNVFLRRDLALGYDHLGEVAQAEGNLSDARAAFQQALDLRKTLAAADFANTELLHEVPARPGDEGAQAALRRAYIRKTMATAELAPATTLRRDLSVSYRHLGEVAQAEGKLSDARAAFQQALEIIKAVAAVDPDNAGWQMDLAMSELYLARLAAESHDPVAPQSGRDAAEAILSDLERKGIAQTHVRFIQLRSAIKAK